jgi:PiT family inorganic phosphate transporter
VIGIGLLKGGKEVKWSVAGKISIGWVILPVITMLISMMILYILKHMFNLNVIF